VQKTDAAWKAISFGRPALASSIVEQGTVMLQNSISPLYLLEMPNLNAAFLATSESGELMLTSLFPNNALSLSKGTKKRARDVFAAISTLPTS
jgi:hypothetical protein